MESYNSLQDIILYKRICDTTQLSRLLQIEISNIVSYSFKLFLPVIQEFNSQLLKSLNIFVKNIVYHCFFFNFVSKKSVLLFSPFFEKGNQISCKWNFNIYQKIMLSLEKILERDTNDEKLIFYLLATCLILITCLSY